MIHPDKSVLAWAGVGILILAVLIGFIVVTNLPQPQPGVALNAVAYAQADATEEAPAADSVELEATPTSAVDRANIPSANHTTLNIARQPVTGGDIEQGRQLLDAYGCGTCHTIPGIASANAFVGPPLNNWAQRSYIAGSLPNTLDNLIAWIVNPQAIEPDTAMPVLGVSNEEARHIGAYLYSLGS